MCVRFYMGYCTLLWAVFIYTYVTEFVMGSFPRNLNACIITWILLEKIMNFDWTRKLVHFCHCSINIKALCMLPTVQWRKLPKQIYPIPGLGWECSLPFCNNIWPHVFFASVLSVAFDLMQPYCSTEVISMKISNLYKCRNGYKMRGIT